MRRAKSRRRSQQARRPWRGTRAGSSQPQLLCALLAAGTTAVIALVISCIDGAESTMQHNYHQQHRHQHDRQGHARTTSDRVTGRATPTHQPPPSDSLVEGGGSSSSGSKSRTAGFTTQTGNGAGGVLSRGYYAAQTHPTTTAAFVTQPVWPTVASRTSSAGAMREGSAAPSPRPSMMMPTRWNGRRHGEQLQDWSHNPRVAGPVERRCSERGNRGNGDAFVQGTRSRPRSVPAAAAASHHSHYSHHHDPKEQQHGLRSAAGLIAPPPQAPDRFAHRTGGGSHGSGKYSNSALSCSAGEAATGGGGGGDGRGEASRGGRGGGGDITRPPLLITIGPQCAGKTSLLRSLASKSNATRGREGEGASGRGNADHGTPPVTDVAIDDHPLVYHKIPTGLLLVGCLRGSPEDVSVGRGYLSDRLREPGCVETRLVALRLEKKISAEEFANGLRGYGGQASPEALAALRHAVESAVSDSVRVSTTTVDVFVRENLFPTAISSSQERLAVAARTSTGLVAWGNTNTQARDYRGALEQAQLTGRPVRFVRWGYELPFLSLEELSRRNVCRFASTGRYVETAAIESALARVDKLYASTSGGNPAGLALAAGFEMDSSGAVRARSSPSSGGHASHRNRKRDGGGGGGGGWAAGGEQARRRVDGFQQGGNFAWHVGSGGHDAPPPPPAARPLPSGHSQLALMNSADHRRYDETTGAPLGLAQEWTPRGGSGGSARVLPGAGNGSSRRWDYSNSGVRVGGGAGGGAGGGGGGTAAGVPPTVMFGNEWGRKRAWRRTSYNDDDIDPTMASCFFRIPANSTGELRRSDLGEGTGPDLEEMELVRRIRSFRERR